MHSPFSVLAVGAQWRWLKQNRLFCAERRIGKWKRDDGHAHRIIEGRQLPVAYIRALSAIFCRASCSGFDRSGQASNHRLRTFLSGRPAHANRVRALSIMKRGSVKPVPRRMYSVSGLVDALDLNALRQDDSNERLKVFEWSTAESIAEHNGSVG
jgi:hypothetical protein